MPPVALYDDMTTSSFSVGKENKGEPEPLLKTLRRRHRVVFQGENVIQEFPRIDAECKKDVWFCRDEYEVIKARNSLLVKMMKKGSFEEGDDHTFRGLEHKLKAVFRQRRANKFNALNAVLEEQDRQFNIGTNEPEAIAVRYRRASMNARENAFAIGLKDAENSYAYKGPEEGDVPDLTAESDESDDDETDARTISSDVNTNGQRIRSLFKSVSGRRSRESYRVSRRLSA